MIQYIRGELAALEEDRIIVDVGGIGYGIFMSVQSMSSLPPVGSEVRIYTYLNVKEDAMQLFSILISSSRFSVVIIRLLILFHPVSEHHIFQCFLKHCLYICIF